MANSIHVSLQARLDQIVAEVLDETRSTLRSVYRIGCLFREASDALEEDFSSWYNSSELKGLYSLEYSRKLARLADYDPHTMETLISSGKVTLGGLIAITPPGNHNAAEDLEEAIEAVEDGIDINERTVKLKRETGSFAPPVELVDDNAEDDEDESNIFSSDYQKDRRGNRAPDSLQAVFEQERGFRSAMNMAGRLRENILKLSETLAGRMVSKGVAVLCEKIQTELEADRPYVGCPYCKARGCEMCREQGWITLRQYNALPSERKNRIPKG